MTQQHWQARWLTGAIIVAALGAAAASSRAQDTYPSRAITMVVPFAPGSGADIGARQLAKQISELLGQNMVVDNRPGANGAIGAQIVARARPDGYTLLMGSATTNATNYAFSAGKLPYSPRDFEAVAGVGASSVMLWVPQSSPAKDILGVIEEARRNPGKLTCGAGNSVTQVACEVFRKQQGLDIQTVLYKSNALSLADISSQQISMAFSDPSAALQYVTQGRVKAVGVAGGKRLQVYPDTPTFKEQGLPDFEITAWTAVFAPAGTPAPILEKLNAAMRRASALEESVTLRQRTGSFDLPFTVAETRRFVEDEIQRWARYVKETGVKAE